MSGDTKDRRNKLPLPIDEWLALGSLEGRARYKKKSTKRRRRKCSTKQVFLDGNKTVDFGR
jgi:hypothetical protein